MNDHRCHLKKKKLLCKVFVTVNDASTTHTELSKIGKNCQFPVSKDSVLILASLF